MAPKKWAAQLAAARAVKEAGKREVAASTQQTELATDTGEAHATAASQPMPGAPLAAFTRYQAP